MAYFTKLINNKVTQVIAVADEDCLKPNGEHSEEVGRVFCEKLTGYPDWKQTSYNTRGGKYYKAGKTGGELEENLQPLTDLIVQKYIDFLPKLNYPIRVGEHPNTAFGLSFAWDYANTTNHEALKNVIEKRAKDFYLSDENCPISWEPGGFDFLSPCLEEAALMKRVLPKKEFKLWLNKFLPQLKNKKYSLETGKVSDRSDGKLVHLDGVNFSRAWSLNKIAEGLPEYKHLELVAKKHIQYSLPHVVGDSYEGGHWLGSFAIYALNSLSDD